MEAGFIETDKITEIYPIENVPTQAERFQQLKSVFEQRFPQSQFVFIARSPGRVNLIGEHIDYSDYSVLPMALADKDILIAFGLNQTRGQINVTNIDDHRFPSRTFQLNGADYVQIDSKKLEWSNYFLSGLKGVLIDLGLTDSDLIGFDCVVDGSVPAGAGVSSSSAFVCCSALGSLKLYQHYCNSSIIKQKAAQVNKKQLTNIAIKSERFVGVNAGGMDQSCSIFGQKDHALLIHFYPSLNIQPVNFPSGCENYAFVISHSLITANKHESGPYCYNLRVVECKLAAAILAKKLDIFKKMGIDYSLQNLGQIKTLRQVQEIYFGRKVGQLSSDSSEFIDPSIISQELSILLNLVEKVFNDIGEQFKAGFSINEVANILEISKENLESVFFDSNFPIELDHGVAKGQGKVQLYRRAKHVFSEALRVFQFRSLNQNSESAQDVWNKLGDLMNQSQESCRDNFNCSHSNLDYLTQICRKYGALGSRLTGAGWGGCCVSLVEKNKLPQFFDGLKNDYYFNNSLPNDIVDISKEADKFKEKMSQILFWTSPGTGAIIFKQ